MTEQPSVEMLIARLGKATQGSRELDLEIEMLIHGDWLRANCIETAEGWRHPEYGKINTESRQYTRSIDDAWSLIPQGWSWKLLYEPAYTVHGERFCAVLRHATKLEHVAPSVVASKETPALALSLAALMTRQTVPQTVGTNRCQKE